MMRGAPPSCGDLQSVMFQPLAGTVQEVRNLSGLWNQYAADDSEADAARVFVGRAASESAFKREAERHRVLHLATHGFFLNNACAPAPTGTRGVGGLARAGARPVENPLLLSGLALAGANRRAHAGPDEDEGILTAEEVASLDLGGVEWAVLSACDTGVGEIEAGEGVFGLRRAFQVAGARTVVMSLWSVEDQATRAWMRRLVRRPLPEETLHRRRRAPGEPDRAARSSREGAEHASVLLGGVCRGRRLAVRMDTGDRIPDTGYRYSEETGPAIASPALVIAIAF